MPGLGFESIVGLMPCVSRLLQLFIHPTNVTSAFELEEAGDRIAFAVELSKYVPLVLPQRFLRDCEDDTRFAGRVPGLLDRR